jgi:hypothetical protein
MSKDSQKQTLGLSQVSIAAFALSGGLFLGLFLASDYWHLGIALGAIFLLVGTFSKAIGINRTRAANKSESMKGS